MLKGNWNLCLGEYKQDFLTKGWRKTLEIGLGYRCFYIKHIFSFHLYYASDRYYYQVIVLMRMANIKQTELLSIMWLQGMQQDFS